MYCRNCGNEIHDDAVVCIHCGVPTSNNNQPQQQNYQQSNTIAIVGFILSFFIALAGLICSIIGLQRANKELNGSGRGFAIAGIVISSISLAVAAIIVIIYIALFIGLVTAI